MLPADTNIEALPWTAKGGMIFIDRPSPTDIRPNRRSRNVRLYFPDHVVQEYLNQTDLVRTTADKLLLEFVSQRCTRINWQHDAPRHEPIPTQLFVIGFDVLFP
jgi:hypothetical protein